MNKIITLLLITCSISALAQKDSILSKKPLAKDFTAEVNFNPFASSPVTINYLRGRFFTTEKSAVRLGFTLGFQNDKPQEKVTASSVELNLRPGYEWHFLGTDRLSPFYGIEADIAFKTSKFTDDNQFADISEIKGAWSTGGAELGFMRFGANFIVGVDFYVAKRLYLGTEFGYGFQYIRYSDIEVISQFDNSKEEGGSSLQLGSNFNSSLRLGFVF